jgi:transposase-like protein
MEMLREQRKQLQLLPDPFFAELDAHNSMVSHLQAHTTILRCVQRYVPEFEKRWSRGSRYARPVGDSWRVDETYLKIKGQWVYLYPVSGCG